MVEIKELRMGNFVKDKDGKLIVVDSIVTAEGTGINAGVSYNGCIPDYYPQDIFPIELSNDILKSCGFYEDKSNDVYERTIFSIQVANGTSLYFDAHKDWMRGDKEVEWYLSHEWNNNHFKNDFWGNPKYLHQLQNLYYCLTGDDLQYAR
jgi:hypothetical protein